MKFRIIIHLLYLTIYHINYMYNVMIIPYIYTILRKAERGWEQFVL